MACVMGTCGGLVEPKTENVEKCTGFLSVFEVQTKGRPRFRHSGGGGPRGEI